MRCSRSTRCRWPVTGSGTRPRGRSLMPAMRTCWPRSCAWTAAHHRPVAGDSELGEAIKLVARSSSEPDLGPDPSRAAAAQRACGSSSRQRWRPSLIWTLPTPSSCSRSHPIRTGPRGCPSRRSPRSLRRANRAQRRGESRADPVGAAGTGAATTRRRSRRRSRRSSPARSGSSPR